MDSLKGKTILIGKEPAQGRLLVAIRDNRRCAAVGTPGSVPPCVSRCMPDQGAAHASLTVDGNGVMVLTNLKPQNVTYVDGAEIASKRVTPSSRVQLGCDRYSIDLALVVRTASQLSTPQRPHDSATIMQGSHRGPVRGPLLDPPPPADDKPVFKIVHLERVWDDMQERRKEIQQRQKRINLIRSGCGLFTMCAFPCIAILGPVGYVMTAVGILGNIYSFVGLKNDNSTEVLERINEDFQDRYVCPNPKCNKFLGNMSYRLLKRQYSMQCPYCKCRYTEC